MKTTIFKGYSEGQEVWAIGKVYGLGETETSFVCQIEPTKEIVEEYERQKNVFIDSGKKKRVFGWALREKRNNKNISD